jgi:hypothetical protein
MAQLELTHNLLTKIEEAKPTMSTSFREQVEKYVERETGRKRGIMSIAGLYVRGNIHYILDNINSPKVEEELRQVNQQ